MPKLFIRHLVKLLLILWLLCMIVKRSEARTTTASVPTKKPNSASDDEPTITSIERPPIHRPAKDKNSTDDSGVTYPPKTNKIRSFLSNTNLQKRLEGWKKLFSRVRHVHEIIATRRSHDVGQGRFMESWMEGAMVPMTFLLMAAFIMDILQRLFPLPYAAFVQQQWAGSQQQQYTYATVAETTRAPDLSKFQVKTPFGSFGVQTNQKKPNWFGRSNIGDVPTVTTTSPDISSVQASPDIPSFQASPDISNDPTSPDIPSVPTSPDINSDYQLDLYLQSLLDNDTAILSLPEGPPPPEYDGYGQQGPSPQNIYSPDGHLIPEGESIYNIGDGEEWLSYGEGWGVPGLDLGGIGPGYGTTAKPGPTGGYGGYTANNGTSNNGGSTGGYGQVAAAVSNTNTDPLAGGSAVYTSIDQLPLNTADLLEYYSRLEANNNLWKRKKRLTVSR